MPLPEIQDDEDLNSILDAAIIKKDYNLTIDLLSSLADKDFKKSKGIGTALFKSKLFPEKIESLPTIDDLKTKPSSGWGKTGQQILKDFIPQMVEVPKDLNELLQFPLKTGGEMLKTIPALTAYGKISDTIPQIAFNYIPKKISKYFRDKDIDAALSSGDYIKAIELKKSQSKYNPDLSSALQKGLTNQNATTEEFLPGIKEHPYIGAPARLLSLISTGKPNDYFPEDFGEGPGAVNFAERKLKELSPVIAGLANPANFIPVSKLLKGSKNIAARLDEIETNKLLKQLSDLNESINLGDIERGQVGGAMDVGEIFKKPAVYPKGTSFSMNPTEGGLSEIDYFTKRKTTPDMNMEGIEFGLADDVLHDRAEFIFPDEHGNRYSPVVSRQYNDPYFNTVPDEMQLLGEETKHPFTPAIEPELASPYFSTIPDRMQLNKTDIVEPIQTRSEIYRDKLPEEVIPEIVNKEVEIPIKQSRPNYPTSYTPTALTSSAWPDAKNIEVKNDKGFKVTGKASMSSRNMEEQLGHAFGREKAQELYGPINQSKYNAAKMTEDQMKLLYDNVVKKYKIKAGSKEEIYAQKYGEWRTRGPELQEKLAKGEITPEQFADDVKLFKVDEKDLIKKFGKQRANDIKGAVRWMDDWYDDWHKAINDVIERRIQAGEVNLKPLPKHENYFRWIKEQKGLFGQLKDVVSPEDLFSGRKSSSGILSSIFRKKGTGRDIKFGLVQGAMDYIPRGAFEVNIQQHLPKMENFAEGIRDKAPNTASMIDQWVKNFKAPDLPGGLEKLLQGTQNLLSRAVIAGNPGTIVKQLGNLPVAISDLKQHIVPGFKKSVYSLFDNNAPFYKGSFYAERYGGIDPDKFYGGIWNSLKRGGKAAMGKPMQLTEMMGSMPTWNGYFSKAESLGLKGQEAINYADDMTRRIYGGRGAGDIPGYWKSTVGKVGTPFFYEQWQGMKKLVEGFGLNKETAIKLALYSGMNYGLNQGLEAMGFGNVGLDPIQTFIDSKDIYDSDDTTTNKVQRIGGRVVSELANAIPGGQYIQTLWPEYGNKGILPKDKVFPRDVMFDASPLIVDAGKDVIKDIGTLIGKKDEEIDYSQLKSPFYLFPGGQPIRRGLKGSYDVGRGYYEKGDVVVPLDKSIENYIRGITSGSSNLPEVREYYKKKRK